MAEERLTLSRTDAPGVASVLSTLFQPLLTGTYLLVAMALLTASSAAQAVIWALATVGLTVVMPTLDLLYRLRSRRITDFQIMLRTERLAPLLVTLTWAGIALLAALVFSAPAGVTVALSVAFVNGVVLISITYWWKISFHTATLVAAVLVLTQQLGQVALLGLLLVAAVGWSRLRLGRHTVAQVLAGIAVSLLATAAVLAFLTARNL